MVEQSAGAMKEKGGGFCGRRKPQEGVGDWYKEMRMWINTVIDGL